MVIPKGGREYPLGAKYPSKETFLLGDKCPRGTAFGLAREVIAHAPRVQRVPEGVSLVRSKQGCSTCGYIPKENEPLIVLIDVGSEWWLELATDPKYCPKCIKSLRSATGGQFVTL